MSWLRVHRGLSLYVSLLCACEGQGGILPLGWFRMPISRLMSATHKLKLPLDTIDVERLIEGQTIRIASCSTLNTEYINVARLLRLPFCLRKSLDFETSFHHAVLHSPCVFGVADFCRILAGCLGFIVAKGMFGAIGWLVIDPNANRRNSPHVCSRGHGPSLSVES